MHNIVRIAFSIARDYREQIGIKHYKENISKTDTPSLSVSLFLSLSLSRSFLSPGLLLGFDTSNESTSPGSNLFLFLLLAKTEKVRAVGETVRERDRETTTGLLYYLGSTGEKQGLKPRSFCNHCA